MKKQQPITGHIFIAAAVASLIAPITAQAGNVTLSGQINRMVANIDNGQDSEIQHLDNSGSGTRFRLKGATETGNGLSVGFYWETQYQSNKSSAADANTVADFGDSFQPRHRDLFIKGGFGKISLGQGNGAANGITEIEYTGTTYLTGYASPEDIWGGVTFGGTSIQVKSVIDGMDALSRNDRLRYDTPKYGPVTLSLDTGSGGKTEVALRFETHMAGGKLKGGIGSWDQNDAGNGKGTAGSIAYLSDSGFNGALSFGQLDSNSAADDPANAMIALGYKAGPHALSLRFGTTDDKTAGVSADAAGLGYVNRSIKGIEMYAGWQNFSVDIAGADDINIVFGGARVKF
jgi:predicted porin